MPCAVPVTRPFFVCAVSPNFRTGEVTAPADHESAPKQLDTPLHVAARLGNTDTVGLLLQSGAGARCVCGVPCCALLTARRAQT